MLRVRMGVSQKAIDGFRVFLRASPCVAALVDICIISLREGVQGTKVTP